MYTQEIADKIAEKLAEGKSLRSICVGDGMPAESTVRKWANLDPAGFGAQYVRARDIGLDAIADDIIAISDEAEVILEANEDGSQYTPRLDATAVARNRLRVEARKWYLSKLAPKRYGERSVIAGDPDAPISLKVDLNAATPEQLRALASIVLPDGDEK